VRSRELVPEDVEPQSLAQSITRDLAGGVAVAVVDEGVNLPAGIDIFEAFQRGGRTEVGAERASASACTSSATSSRRWEARSPLIPTRRQAPRFDSP